MAKEINLTSQVWCDLIFKNKNKEYGAYEIRKTSGNRHLTALGIVFLMVVAFAFLPGFIRKMIPVKADTGETFGPVVLSTFDPFEQKIPEENIVKAVESVPPPPVLKSTIKFTAPVVAPDETVNEEDMMNTQTELTDSRAAISVANVEGADDGSGTDIADLIDHQVIVGDQKPEIYEHVEQMPMFPGGDSELMSYLSKNIKYPQISIEQGVQGTVVLRFVVNKDGDVKDVSVFRSLDPSCDREAIRVVSNMPKWIAGKQNGNAVNVYFSLPVRFRLQ